jgi:hypothetical protein
VQVLVCKSLLLCSHIWAQFQAQGRWPWLPNKREHKGSTTYPKTSQPDRSLLRRLFSRTRCRSTPVLLCLARLFPHLIRSFCDQSDPIPLIEDAFSSDDDEKGDNDDAAHPEIPAEAFASNIAKEAGLAGLRVVGATLAEHAGFDSACHRAIHGLAYQEKELTLGAFL